MAETAPYFRDGHAATLDDVIDFYDRGGDPVGTFLGGPKEIQPPHLSAEEKEWLKEFLKTLTGEAVPAQYLQDLHNP
jgi:cytochrome c peroxidase